MPIAPSISHNPDMVFLGACTYGEIPDLYSIKEPAIDSAEVID